MIWRQERLITFSPFSQIVHMNKEEILKAAYLKAYKNKWNAKAYLVADSFLQEKGLASDTFMIFIFSHDFAKTFWGEDEVKVYEGEIREDFGTLFQDRWEFHLAEMVLEENPIDYLAQFL